jgi:glycosyltransferase involved in cell wall biosynthesis
MLSATLDPGWPAGVVLLIAGKGARSDEVRTAAAASDRVVYLSQVPYRDVPAVIRGAQAILSVQGAMRRTTTGGVNPLKVYEALACGVPVIVADHPGQADLVREEACGWIVPPDDPAAIARAVGEVITDPGEAKARGYRGRRAVLREHSWDARAASTHEALLELLGRHHS